MKSKGLLVVACIALAAGVQAAETMFYTGSVGITAPGSTAVPIIQFDTLGGTRTLTGVKLELVTAQEYANLTLFNSDVAAAWTVTLNGGTVTFGEGGNTTVANLISSTPQAMGAGQTLTGDFASNVATASSNYGALANLVGSGTYNGMTVTFDGTWSGAGMQSGDSIVINSFIGEAGWKVTYTYEVPEPTSLGLLALGAMALGMRRRSKKTV